MMFNLDSWQKEFIECKTHKILVSGRQTGKSEAAAIDNGEFAANNPNTVCLLISKTERQAEELLTKTLRYVGDNYKGMIKHGLHKPIKSRFELTNGSKVISLPTGQSGEGIRFLTIHKLTCDEAQLCNPEIFTAVTPMLLTTGGTISLLGTPQGKKGYFYECFLNKLNQFKVIHVNSEEVIKNRPISESWPEWRKTAALAHLEQERSRMSEKQFAQEYLGQFIEDLYNLFSDEIIKQTLTLPQVFSPLLSPEGANFLGADIGAQQDPTVLFSVRRSADKKQLAQIGMKITRGTMLTDTLRHIKNLDESFHYKKMYIDSSGLGMGVTHQLLDDSKYARRTVEINNASRSIDRDNTQRRRLLKEDLYANLLRLMEQKALQLCNDPDIAASLKSMQYENNEGKVRIWGSDSHIAEALARACWCMTDKTLDLWAR